MVLSRQEWFAEHHLCEDAPDTPYIDLFGVSSEGEHDFGGSVVAGRDVAGHLGLLHSGKAEIAYLQVAVLVDEYVRRLEVAVDYPGGVYVFKAALDLLVNHRFEESGGRWNPTKI